MVDVRAMSATGVRGMDQAIELLRAGGERDLANALTSVRKRWGTVVEKHLVEREQAVVAAQKAAVERALRIVLSVELPIRTFTEANLHEHHMQRHKRMGDQRPTVAMAMRANANARGIKVSLPCTVRTWRLAPAELDTNGNLQTALKAVMDGIADWLGINDRDPRVKWECDQVKRAQYGILVEVLSC